MLAIALSGCGLLACFAQPATDPRTDRSAWLREARWGVFTHYLVGADMTAGEWNQRVESFDVNALADQLEAAGAPYYVITIGQNSGHYCSPNATYDRLVGIQPSRCSRRDLVADLYGALAPRGIRLLVYLPSGAPAADHVACDRLGWEWGFEGSWPDAWGTTRTGKRLAEFQIRWESVIREWSERWGPKVCGWWFDGCYFADEMYRHPDPPNFASFAAAARGGNPASIVAFNPGVLYPVVCHSSEEDYTAGEIGDPWALEPPGPSVGGAQYHVLTFLGSTWGAGPLRYTRERVVRYTRSIVDRGGAITWDMPISPEGRIPPEFIAQVAGLSSALDAAEPDTPIPPGNLAYRKPADLLSLDGERRLQVNGGMYYPRLGVDGDALTFAQAGGEWPWSYQVDLTKVASVGRVVVTFGPRWPTEYEIAVSADGAQWHTVANGAGSAHGRHEHVFPGRAARLVRVLGLKPDGPGQEGGQMSVAECEVYGE
jgi:hypothetical protein